METISTEELKAKLERGDPFKLVMALPEWAYQAKHIPGSIFLANPRAERDKLDPQDEIFVYCSNEACISSIAAYKFLKANGFEHVRRYSPGLDGWEQAGYALEGEMVAAG